MYLVSLKIKRLLHPETESLSFLSVKPEPYLAVDDAIGSWMLTKSDLDFTYDAKVVGHELKKITLLDYIYFLLYDKIYPILNKD